MNVNFAERAHNHNWKLDPIVRSLLDTDFYKLLMLQYIWKNFAHIHVTSEVTNRTVKMRLADRVGAAALIEQMEHVRQLKFRRSELVWLAGNTFYGTRSIFSPEFLEWLERDFKLSEYTVSEHDGQLVLRFSGLWTDVSMWEVYALAIVSELKTRTALAELTELELDVLYARAKTRLWDKIKLLTAPGLEGLQISDFGTRRRHSFLWQEYAITLARTTLGDSFAGTSNTYLAYKHDMEAIGTNAHELPMALAALATDDATLKTSQYRILELWQQTYQGELLIMLPDTFGTTQFLASAPEWTANWTGQRMDSKDPFIAGDEYIAWLQKRGRDPRKKLLIASDALDVDSILALHAYFSGAILGNTMPEDFHSAADFLDPQKWKPERRIRFSSGWGTLLTNDFRGCDPDDGAHFDPISLVCKLTSADGHPAVKLSDNYAKASGIPSEVERYRRVFGTAGVANAPVLI